jgi:hypothetical protein
MRPNLILAQRMHPPRASGVAWDEAIPVFQDTTIQRRDLVDRWNVNFGKSPLLYTRSVATFSTNTYALLHFDLSHLVGRTVLQAELNVVSGATTAFSELAAGTVIRRVEGGWIDGDGDHDLLDRSTAFPDHTGPGPTFLKKSVDPELDWSGTSGNPAALDGIVNTYDTVPIFTGTGAPTYTFFPNEAGFLAGQEIRINSVDTGKHGTSTGSGGGVLPPQDGNDLNSLIQGTLDARGGDLRLQLGSQSTVPGTFHICSKEHPLGEAVQPMLFLRVI